MSDIPIGALPKRPKRPSYKTVRHSRVDHLLAAAGGGAAEEYEALLLDPRTLAKDAQAWLLARGLRVSKAAVDRHRRRFLIARRASRHKAEEAGRVATAVAAVFKHFGPEQCGQFLLHGHQFLLFKRLMELEQEEFDAMPVREIRELGELVFRSVRAQVELTRLQSAAAVQAAAPNAPAPPPRRKGPPAR